MMVRRSWVVWAPVVLLAMLVGCSGRPRDQADPLGPTGPKPSAPAASNLKPVQAKGTTTLKGRVIISSEPDYAAMTEKFLTNVTKDRDLCLKGTGEEVSQNTWVVDRASKGVKYVFVWLRPLDDREQFFDV